MEIKHQELEIDEQNPFSACKLDRQQFAEILTSIVATLADGFVFAINNEWGTGKTTFVKMWQQHLKNGEFKTVYFNAWENDFDANPLVAIMAELSSLTEKSNKVAFKSALQKGAVLSKNVLPGILKAVTKRYIDTQEILDAIENATKATTEILQSEIDEYAKKKQSIAEFRDKLEKFVTKTDGEKPIVFIIDELDRCRPNYAVEVLEQMKHFFSVKGIVFVLSIDKNHLAASIRGFYGSEQINTDEYLRRFIDLEYSIPRPSAEQFCKYLYQYYSFDDFFRSEERRRHSELQNDGVNFQKMASSLFRKSNSTLRQMEKVFGQTRLILNSFKSNEYTLSEVLFVIVYLSAIKPDLYLKIQAGQMTTQELSDVYTALVPSDRQLNHFLIYTEARLLILYDNELSDGQTSLVSGDDDGNVSTTVKSSLENDGSNQLAKAMNYIYGDWHLRNIKLRYLTNKVDLTEPLIFQ